MELNALLDINYMQLNFWHKTQQNLSATHNAVLYTEAQLVAEVWPSDEHSGHWRTSDNVQLNAGLVL